MNKIRGCIRAVKKYSIVKNIFLSALFILFLMTVFLICNLSIDCKKDCEHIDNLLSTMAGVVGTIVAIVFSMMLLIIERISTKYSPKFLYYTLRNPIFIITVLYSITLIFFCFFPNQLLSDSDLLCVALSAFVGFLLLFVVSLKETVRLMSPKESILKPEVRSICKWMKKKIERDEIAQRSSYMNLGRVYDVPDNIEKQLEEKMLPIRDMIVRSILSNNIQEAADGINAFTVVILSYLSYRKNYLGDTDKFLFFVYSEFQNIALIASKTGYLHLRIHPILAQSLGHTSKAGLQVKISRAKVVSTNNLITFPVKEIQNLCIQNLKHYNSSTPSVACTTLEEIGLSALDNGFMDESVSVAEMLSQISIIALTTKPPDLYFLSHQSNTSIMKIAIGMAQSSSTFRGDYNLDYSLKAIVNTTIKNVIATLTAKKEDYCELIDPLSPFISQMYDLPRNGYSLANFVGSLLFTREYPALPDETFEYISNELYSGIFRLIAKRLGDQNTIRSKQFVDTVYLSQLMILAIFSKELRESLFGESTKISSDFDKNKAMQIFQNGIDILWAYYDKNKRQKYDNNHILDAIFSLMLICLADNDINKEFSGYIEKHLREMYSSYRSREYTSQDTFFKYCRMTNKFVKNITGKKQNIITDIPKYEDEHSAVYSYGPAIDRSIPCGNHSEIAFFERRYPKQQWKVLGTYTMQNAFFDKINKRLWKDHR